MRRSWRYKPHRCGDRSGATSVTGNSRKNPKETFETPRPIVVTSACLGFEACRYNGNIISAPFVRRLSSCVEFLKICPEVEIGLGTPRDPIRLTVSGKGERLVQPNTARDLTRKMISFARTYLDSLPPVDGFILKSRSPSCAIRDAKIHAETEREGVAGKGAGLFTRAVLERFPHAAVEDEDRLNSSPIRQHFLTKLFVQARYRQVRQTATIQDLVRFHTDHKFLLMAYDQTRLRKLGRLVAGSDKRDLQGLFDAYGEHLGAAFGRVPRYTSNINVLLHAFGYFSHRLSNREKACFFDALESYRGKRTPLDSVTTIIKAWINRFDDSYLARQIYFDPYPQILCRD